MDKLCTRVLNPILNSIKVHSQSNAIRINDQFYTYEEFGKCIERVRQTLQSKFISNRIVGLECNDDLETYASIFAVWLEGMAYVPLGYDWPKDCRNAAIHKAEIFYSLSSGRLVYVNDCITQASSDNSQNEVSDDSLACVLFTSGSSGVAKGVQFTRKNVASCLNFLVSMKMSLTTTDYFLMYPELTFVGSLASIIFPLINGACCLTIPIGRIKYLYVVSLLESFYIKYLVTPFSIARILLSYVDEIKLENCSFWLVSGETIKIEIVEKWLDIFRHITFVNLYGSSETTAIGTALLISSGDYHTENPTYNSVGCTVSGVTALIVDENDNAVPVGVKGEICFAGENIMLGYFGDEFLNEQSFFNKTIKGESLRFFRMGDIGYVDKEGNIFVCGRKNSMVKINGMRVELNEIEYHAEQFLKHIRTVSLPYENETGAYQIALFAESQILDEEGLLAYLKSKMPQYMIPAKVIMLQTFPLLKTGKIDRIKLRSLL